MSAYKIRIIGYFIRFTAFPFYPSLFKISLCISNMSSTEFDCRQNNLHVNVKLYLIALKVYNCMVI